MEPPPPGPLQPLHWHPPASSPADKPASSRYFKAFVPRATCLIPELLSSVGTRLRRQGLLFSIRFCVSRSNFLHYSFLHTCVCARTHSHTVFLVPSSSHVIVFLVCRDNEIFFNIVFKGNIVFLLFHDRSILWKQVR